jgi:hypothetical protein
MAWIWLCHLPWDKYTCFYAASGGHLETLKWARENGCPWDKYKCLKEAQKFNHKYVVNYINQ